VLLLFLPIRGFFSFCMDVGDADYRVFTCTCTYLPAYLPGYLGCLPWVGLEFVLGLSLWLVSWLVSLRVAT